MNPPLNEGLNLGRFPVFMLSLLFCSSVRLAKYCGAPGQANLEQTSLPGCLTSAATHLLGRQCMS